MTKTHQLHQNHQKLFLVIIVFTVLVFVFSHVVTASSSSSTASTHINLFTTWSTILSGGLSDCSTPSDITATDCIGGLASADAFIRNHTNITNEQFLFSWTLDRGAPFVQMHPLDWGVNRLALQTIFNYSHFRATHATLTSTRNMSYLQNEEFPLLLRSKTFLHWWKR